MKVDTIVIRIMMIEVDGMTAMIRIKISTRTMTEVDGMTGRTTSQSNEIFSVERLVVLYFATVSDT